MRLIPISLLITCFLLLSPQIHAKKQPKINTSNSEIAPPLTTLYNTLDPLSISQHLAFYELYPETSEGKRALRRAWELVSGGAPSPFTGSTPLPTQDIQAIVSLVTRQPCDPPVVLSNEQLQLIQEVASKRLTNKSLKGHSIWTKEEVLALPSSEIDLSRGLLIFQLDEAADPAQEVVQYEASLDLLALQILARLSPQSTPLQKIREINRFIFEEMQFRFPPHSLYAKDIDLYTFLPSVLDSRQGVCLGVSILYLSLAQRLGLSLDIITPPGHIYVSYENEGVRVNIETTARGIDLPSDTYLGVDTRSLQRRTMKEVIGLAFMNQAAVYWEKKDYKKSVALYEKARLFLPTDPLLKFFLGCNDLFVGKTNEGVKLLKEVRGIPLEDMVSTETIPEDYLNGKVDIAGIKAVFAHVDETRDSIVKKQKELKTLLKKYPYFRAGILHLAITWLQLGRGSEAKEVLERYHKIDPTHATVEYYLTILSMERFDYNQAWNYLASTQKLTEARNHHPKALTSLRQHLRRLSPSPSKT